MKSCRGVVEALAQLLTKEGGNMSTQCLLLTWKVLLSAKKEFTHSTSFSLLTSVFNGTP